MLLWWTAIPIGLVFSACREAAVDPRVSFPTSDSILGNTVCQRKLHMAAVWSSYKNRLRNSSRIGKYTTRNPLLHFPIATVGLSWLLSKLRGLSGSLDVDSYQRAMLSYKNTVDPVTRFSPALAVFGRQVCQSYLRSSILITRGRINSNTGRKPWHRGIMHIMKPGLNTQPSWYL